MPTRYRPARTRLARLPQPSTPCSNGGVADETSLQPHMRRHLEHQEHWWSGVSAWQQQQQQQHTIGRDVLSSSVTNQQARQEPSPRARATPAPASVAENEDSARQGRSSDVTGHAHAAAAAEERGDDSRNQSHNLSTPTAVTLSSSVLARRRNARASLFDLDRQPSSPDAMALSQPTPRRWLQLERATRTRRTSTNNATNVSSAETTSSSPTIFSSELVVQLDCLYCSANITNRGMGGKLRAEPCNQELYSTDAEPSSVALIGNARHAPTCRCLVRDAACLTCGNAVGYHVETPCTRCLGDCTNGHMWIFHSQCTIATIRQAPGQPAAMVWGRLPSPMQDPLLQLAAQPDAPATYSAKPCR
ncbi:FAM72A protein [Capsaspora owczarzaki ATCC 30864]|uniref:FAM72A protein n=1 Tax=Capsaspora owczarzaki (strain ATCC 30864) TaxID=595528 RepID=A0A0D2UFB1_CAPO3|nr:FAM72A protein [Capsaspora owczarzaki ATCC 30864]KJE93801.1 FAM72A protein [Capsaspora owczarzaki ATCC 30864]|eukprot:XP_004347291.1 FAM72A protein [Capsaspora owczarzaki ATCC 30864]